MDSGGSHVCGACPPASLLARADVLPFDRGRSIGQSLRHLLHKLDLRTPRKTQGEQKRIQEATDPALQKRSKEIATGSIKTYTFSYKKAAMSLG